MATNPSSILDSTKKILGLTVDYDVFDLDVIAHINTALTTLTEIGVGPEGGFFITNQDETWEELIGTDARLNSVRSYVYLRVRLLFDPPTSSFAIASMEKQIQEMEWRLLVAADKEGR